MTMSPFLRCMTKTTMVLLMATTTFYSVIKFSHRSQYKNRVKYFSFNGDRNFSVNPVTLDGFGQRVLHHPGHFWAVHFYILRLHDLFRVPHLIIFYGRPFYVRMHASFLKNQFIKIDVLHTLSYCRGAVRFLFMKKLMSSSKTSHSGGGGDKPLIFKFYLYCSFTRLRWVRNL